ncbi:unnamed protein product [Closterium sp. NIES-64]|nr:unnamed protein product [Closterium sp. NIES-64]
MASACVASSSRQTSPGCDAITANDLAKLMAKKSSFEKAVKDLAALVAAQYLPLLWTSSRSEAGVVPLAGVGSTGVSGSTGSSSSGGKSEKGESVGLRGEGVDGEGKGEEGEGSADECSVCREKWEVGDKLREMPCSHRFHVDCLQPWLDEHNSCPLCRYEMPTDDHVYERRKEREKEEEEERRAAATMLPCCLAVWGCACCGWAVHRLVRKGADASRDWPAASKDEMADFPRLATLILASYEPDLPKCLQLLESVSDDHGNIPPQTDAAAAGKPSKQSDSDATHAQSAKEKDPIRIQRQGRSAERKAEVIEARVLRKVEQRETEGQCPSYLVYLDEANEDITVAMRMQT